MVEGRKVIKVIFRNSIIKFESVDGLTIQQLVVQNKDHFQGISINHSPMKILKRNPITNMPSSCVQLNWDYVVRNDDEIEFFSPSGVYDLQQG